MTTPRVQSVVKAFAIVNVLRSSDASMMSLRQIADASELSLSTTHRFLLTLLDVGAVCQHPDGSYALEPFGARDGGLPEPDEVQANAKIDARIVDAVRRLSLEVGTTVHLCSLRGDMVRCLAKATAREKVSVRSSVGSEFECYFTAAGKTLMANMSRPKIDAYLKDGEFYQITKNTISDRSRLSDELQSIRTSGYALDRFEFYDDVFCIAVPVWKHDRVFASISASFGKGSVSTDMIAPISRKLIAAAEAFSDFDLEALSGQLDVGRETRFIA